MDELPKARRRKSVGRRDSSLPCPLRGAGSLAYPRPLVALSTLVGKEARAEEEAAFPCP